MAFPIAAPETFLSNLQPRYPFLKFDAILKTAPINEAIKAATI